MGCEGYREALSARLDGEAGPAGLAGPAGPPDLDAGLHTGPEADLDADLDADVDPDLDADLDAHLARCPDCRRWADDAAAINRLARTGAAMASVDVTAAVLPAAPGRWRGRLAIALRVALGALGTAQLVLGLLQLTALRPEAETHVHGTTPDGASPSHLWHESAAWNIAVGAAFVWVAARRGRPGGIVPILTAFIGVLMLLSATDMVLGRVELTRLASHGFVLAGYLIVLSLTRPSLDLHPPGQRRGRSPQRRSAPEQTADTADRIIPLPGLRRGPDRGNPAASVRGNRAA